MARPDERKAKPSGRARGSSRNAQGGGTPSDRGTSAESGKGGTARAEGSPRQGRTEPPRDDSRAPTEFDRQFQTLFETTIDGILIADPETRGFRAANPAFCRMVGYAPEEVKQMGVPDMHPEEEVARQIEEFDRLVSREQHIVRDAVVKRKDGSLFYADIHCIPVILAGKRYMAGFFRDVSERRQADERLRESEERYRTLVESAGETIAMVDRNGVFLFMNKMAAARLGGTPDEYVGKTMWDLFPQATADRQAGTIRKVIDTGKRANVVTLTVVRGRERWYNTTIEPIRHATGKVTAALVIGRDIDELRRTREELEQYRLKMARAERLASLGALSATIAHELTQPLTVSRLSLQEAMAQLEAPQCPAAVVETLRECLEGISDATQRVERFRGFARQSSKQTPQEVHLQDVVRRTVRLLTGKASERRVSLAARGLDALPPVRANEKDMEQMCFALIENAIHAADGSKPRKLLIDGHVGGRRITLRFEDDCGGIPPENADKIFEPFFTTKPDGEGTGLGLCIVERAVTQAHGEIRVENHPGEGVTFSVALPIPPSKP